MRAEVSRVGADAVEADAFQAGKDMAEEPVKEIFASDGGGQIVRAMGIKDETKKDVVEVAFMEAADDGGNV